MSFNELTQESDVKRSNNQRLEQELLDVIESVEGIRLKTVALADLRKEFESSVSQQQILRSQIAALERRMSSMSTEHQREQQSLNDKHAKEAKDYEEQWLQKFKSTHIEHKAREERLRVEAESKITESRFG